MSQSEGKKEDEVAMKIEDQSIIEPSKEENTEKNNNANENKD